MLCVSKCGCTWKWIFLDEEDFVLSQLSTCEFNETQSAGYGDDIIEGSNNVVSLETNLDSNSYVRNQDEFGKCSYGGDQVCDSVAIEDITDDEGGDAM